MMSSRSVTSTPDGSVEPFSVGVGSWRPQRDLHNLDVGAGEDRVERGGEPASPVADEEPEVIGPVSRLHE